MTIQDDARAALVERFADQGITFSDEVLDAVVLNLPVGGFVTAASDRVRWEWWDGTSPVNGVPAEQVRARFTIPGLAFLVYVDDQLVYFQPHDPLADGLVPLTVDSDPVVVSFVNDVVQRLAFEAFMTVAGFQLQQVALQQQARTGVVPTPADMNPNAVRRRRAAALGLGG
jgi:hypothetical protein